METKIYIADDEQHIRDMERIFLENEGYIVEDFPDGEKLLERCRIELPELVVLDVMMPGMSGLEICSLLRQNSAVPILMVSAKDSPIDRVTGLTIGSDDYLVKPFLPLELVARVKALLRRAAFRNASELDTAEQAIEMGNLRMVRGQRLLRIGGESCQVTPMEFEFLYYLLSRPEAVSKEELLHQVWGYRDIPMDMRVTDDLVKRLRKKLNQAGSTVQIETVWGFGYRLKETETGRMGSR